MDFRRVMCPEQQDFQMPPPWIPGTPAKSQHAAAAGGQGNPAAATNWLESVVGLSPGVVYCSRTVEEGACQNGSAGPAGVAGRMLDLNSCEAGVASQSDISGSNFSLQTLARWGSAQGWPSVRYSDLVAMAANAGAPSSVITDHDQSGSPLLLNGRVMLSTELLNGAQSLSAPRETMPPPFAPVTPEKEKGAQDGRHLVSTDSVDGREIARGGWENPGIAPTFNPKGKDPVHLHCDQGISEQTMLMGFSGQLQEIETQKKAEEEGVDLNKTPAQKTRRKKHRPKVVVEGKLARTPKPATPKPAGAGESSSGKRKYVRRKGINSPLETTSLSMLGGETVKPHVKRARSVRRCLDFSDKDGKVSCLGTNNTVQAQMYSAPERNIVHNSGNSTSYGTKSTNVLNGQNVEINSSAGIALALNNSNNQTLDGYLNSLDIPSLPLQPSRRELIRDNLKKLARMRDSRQVLNYETTTHIALHTGCQSTPENLCTLTTTSTMMPRDKHMGMNEWKMENNLLTNASRVQRSKEVPADFNFKQTCDYRMNRGSHYQRNRNNELPYFPETPKKRRTPKVQNGLPFRKVASFADGERILKLDRLRAVEGKQAPGKTESKTMNRSTVPLQCCSLAFLTDNIKSYQLPTSLHKPELNNGRQKNGVIHGPQACVEALAADLLAKVRRKRRTKKEQVQDFSFTSVLHNTSNYSGAIVPYMQGNEALDPLDAIVHKMKCLNINRDHESKVQDQSAIVPYGPYSMMVPFEGQFDPRKKPRPRAKVDLDQETNRVWKLLMGKESNDGIDRTDIDKEKWWEEERRVFHGRADSFIARMHLVQGDRRFSAWKGSVLDSVIGVFLTQNVSDHLSSSAFMALAARFPHQSSMKNKETNCDKASTLMGQTTVCTVDLNIADSSDQQVCDSIQVAVHEPEQMEEKEMHPVGSSIEGDMYPHPELFNHPLRERRSLTGADDRRPLDDIHSSQNSVVSSQNSSDDLAPTTDQLCSISESKSEAVDHLTAKNGSLEPRTSFVQLLEFCASSTRRNSRTEICNTAYMNMLERGWVLGEQRPSFSILPNDFRTLGTRGCLLAEDASDLSSHDKSALTNRSSFGSQASMGNLTAQSLSRSSTSTCYDKHSYNDDIFTRVTAEALTDHSFHNYSRLQEDWIMEIQGKERGSGIIDKMIGSDALAETQTSKSHQVHSGSAYFKEKSDVECLTMEDREKHIADKPVEENSKEACSSSKDPIAEASTAPRTRRGRSEKEKSKTFDWENLRRQACQNGAKKERSRDTMDSLDWEAVRNADVSEISNTIRERGMNNMLAERIKGFLDRLVRDHGSIDLEWLRDVPPDKAKDYLLSIRGLGLKSVECVRLLTLHHLAFPVDTNVGRICVRLGWVPLQPLPESLQLHLLELYPMLETIQKYLWPRLCTLDQRTLYELHYQMITFGKVFCTKSKPNCNACPMRGECKHFASAFASARLALPGPEEKNLVTATMEHNHKTVTSSGSLPQIEGYSLSQQVCVGSNCEPIIEEPATPEPECTQILDIPDIEDAFYEDPDEIPTIKLNAKEFAQNLQNYMQQNNMDLQNVDWSKALVTLTPEAASIPTPKLKNVSRLRTEHQVYELPDSHSLLEGLDQREPQDPCPYLLAIWTPGETAQSTEPPESCSNAQGTGNLCDKSTCFSCNSIREAQAHTVRGTLLIPCRTAMRGSFPLNGTYFQVNEVFADHESSLAPIHVPRALIWNLPRRTVYFGTSIPSIFKGLAIEDIQNCFWRGFVCVRGFDRKTRRPRSLMARLHFPASKATRGKKPAAKDDE